MMIWIFLSLIALAVIFMLIRRSNIKEELKEVFLLLLKLSLLVGLFFFLVALSLAISEFTNILVACMVFFFVIVAVILAIVKHKEFMAGMMEAVLKGMSDAISEAFEKLPMVLTTVIEVALTVLVGGLVYLYINVYYPLSNNEWEAMSLFSYPEWFFEISDKAQKELMNRGENSVISSIPFSIPLHPWFIKFEIREILENSKVAWTYKKNDKAIFYIVWYDDGYHFAKISRYWLDDLKNKKDVKRKL